MNDEIRRGMERQLREWRREVEASGRRVGWKIGFNDPRAQARFGLEATLVGHLRERSRLEPGRTVALENGMDARAEVEIAIELSANVPAGGDLDAARAAIGRILPALEFVDFARSFESVETILAHDIFHHAVVFGPDGTGREGPALEGVTARAWKNDEKVVDGDMDLVPADLAEVVRHVADTLGAFGERLVAGERIIAGSLVMPISVRAGDLIRADLGPLGQISTELTAELA
jgi:2-keto-4-pentenoate hydratase